MIAKLGLGILIVVVTACTANQDPPTPDIPGADVAIVTNTGPAALPNPASVYCEQRGNRLEIQTAADGSQSGVCIFPDGTQCDEWAYYRGQCPAPVSMPEQSAYAGWIEYADSGYGFRFRYPPEWTAALDMRPESTSYKHLLWLRAPGEPLPDVVLSIAFERVGEDFGLQRTGIGAGELVERGGVMFLGAPLKRVALVLEGNDMEVMYGGTGLFDRGDMRFAIGLAYKGMERRGLTPELEQTADQIVSSFERTP